MNFESAIAPVGSPLYYSVKRLNAFDKQQVLAVYAFYKEIETITLTYSDVHIAHAKLQWWRSEILKLSSMDTSHPLARYLPQAFSPQLLEIIDGLEQNLTCPQFETFEEVYIHFMRTAGKRDGLIYSLLTGIQSVFLPLELIYQMSFAIEFTKYLQHLRQYIGRSLVYFAKEELCQFNITEKELNHFQTTPAITDFLKFQTVKIKKAFNEVFAKREKETLPLHHLIQCKIAEVELQGIEKNKFRVLEERLDLSPLKYWWIAFWVTSTYPF